MACIQFAHLNGSKGKEMKGEGTRITHVDSDICIRSEVLRGVICPEVHENGSKKKKKWRVNGSFDRCGHNPPTTSAIL